MPAGYKGISSGEYTGIELVQGIPIQMTAGLGKGSVRDTAYISESTQTFPITITGQACKEAIEHDLLGGAALADQGPDEMG